MLGGFPIFLFLLLVLIGDRHALYIDDKMGIISDDINHDLLVTNQNVDPADCPIIIEGDIEISPLRNAIAGDFMLWPNGVIPYIISSEFPDTEKEKILRAMREIEHNVNGQEEKCIQFVPRTDEINYLLVQVKPGICSSNVGMIGLMQTLNLGAGCMAKGIIMHELTHAIGFWHEQASPIRNNYVDIHWDNVLGGNRFNFDVQRDARLLNAPYDYASIMHYTAYEFAEDVRKPVMTPKAGHVVKGQMGQRLGLTATDVLKIQRLYNCTEDVSHIKHPDMTPEDQCDFNLDLCSFTNSPDDDFDWHVVSGPSESGPFADSSTGNGQYAIAIAKDNQGKLARLVTRNYTELVLCLDFYSYQTDGALKIMVNSPAFANARTQTTLRGRSPAKWYHVSISVNVDLTHVTSYQLYFEAEIDQHDIAIDDLNIYTGTCF